MNDDQEMSGQALRQFAEALRQTLVKQRRSDYDLGHYLMRVRASRLYLRWPRRDRRKKGYSDWPEFCDKELGFKRRKADALSSNYQRLAAMKLNEKSLVFTRAMRLGWSKLNLLLRVAGDAHGLEQWLTAIDGEELSELQLRAKVQEALRIHAQRSGQGDNPGSVGDGGGDPDDPDSGNTAGSIGYNVRFPDQQSVETFVKAVEAIRRRYGEEVGMGKCIAMMALQYLATKPKDSEGGATAELENIIVLFEAAYGIKLQVVKSKRCRKAPVKKRRSRTLAKMRKNEKTR